MSFGNWPFLVFLLVLAGALSIIPAMNGNWLIVAGMMGAVLLVPLLFAVFQPMFELLGLRSVHAIHEHGLVWRRGWLRGFIPWSQVAAINRVVHDVDGTTFTAWEVHERVRGAGVITLGDAVGCAEAAELISRKLAR
jgi:hypothetical protein